MVALRQDNSASSSQGSPVGSDDADQLIGMGALLKQLQSEFPDVSASKVRFLEDQGLLCPARTPSGYRKFSASDRERLRQVLTLQRERYLPLKVIRELSENGQLDTLLDRDDPAPPLSDSTLGEVAVESDDEPLTMRELCRRSGAGISLVRELISFGLLRERPGGFDHYDLAIAGAAHALREHGVEPRHLRTLRQAADRESGLVEQAIAPDMARRSPTASRRASQRAEDITQLCLSIHASLLMGQLRSIQQRLDVTNQD